MYVNTVYSDHINYVVYSVLFIDVDSAEQRTSEFWVEIDTYHDTDTCTQVRLFTVTREYSTETSGADL